MILNFLRECIFMMCFIHSPCKVWSKEHCRLCLHSGPHLVWWRLKMFTYNSIWISVHLIVLCNIFDLLFLVIIVGFSSCNGQDRISFGLQLNFFKIIFCRLNNTIHVFLVFFLSYTQSLYLVFAMIHNFEMFSSLTWWKWIILSKFCLSSSLLQKVTRIFKFCHRWMKCWLLLPRP